MEGEDEGEDDVEASELEERYRRAQALVSARPGLKHGRREAARRVARREELEALLDPGDAVGGDGR